MTMFPNVTIIFTLMVSLKLVELTFTTNLILHNYLGRVFVISRIVKVEVRVITVNRRPRLITLANKRNEKKNKQWKSCFCLFSCGKQPKARELDMITRDLECP